MVILITIICTLGIVGGFAASFYFGYKLGRKNKSPTKQLPVSEEQKEKIEKFNAQFQNLMNYDVNKAMGRGKLNG